MTLREAERQIQERWMALTEEERFLTAGGMYEAEKEILQFLAPKGYSKRDVQEFVFFHMHGMTIHECINRVPGRIP